MKRSRKITICAMMAALATVVMLLSFFPYFIYAIPAVAGLFIMVAVIEINCKWAFGAYIASALLVFLMADPESKLLYIFFFGYYPIAKALVEKLRNPIIEWIIKAVIFNASVLLVYFVFAGAMGVSVEEFGEFGKYGALILLAVGNVVFVLYDIAVSRMAIFYFAIIKPKFKGFRL